MPAFCGKLRVQQPAFGIQLAISLHDGSFKLEHLVYARPARLMAPAAVRLQLVYPTIAAAASKLCV